MNADAQKRAAAARALEFVRPGMRLGLGTGSTARHFVELVGERVRAGLKVVAVPTSQATRADAERVGIPLTTLDETPELDLTVDGADEIAPDLSLIKGGGGALLREKIVASASDRMVVISDGSKLVPHLGGGFALPVEIVPFGWEVTIGRLRDRSREARLRRLPDGAPFVTDGGHYIVDCDLAPTPDPGALERDLNAVVGVVETGLFVGIAEEAYIADAGGVRRLTRG